MSTFRDRAAPILRSAIIPPLTQDQKADIWDLYHQSADANELAGHLSELNLHPELKQQLIEAKRKPAMEPDDTDKALGVLNHMSTMDPKVLDLVEQHPNVLKVFLAAHGGKE